MMNAQKRINKILALRLDWKRHPHFKETCRQTWDPIFFAQCEEIIANLDNVDAIIRKNLVEGSKTFDIASWVPEVH